MNCRQWVVDVYASADALTLNDYSFWFPELTGNQKLETLLMLFCYCARQIHHGQ
jgi:hypothetical protein